MAQVSLAQSVQSEASGDSGKAGKTQGTFKVDGKEHTVFVFSESEAVSEAACKFLQEANLQKKMPDVLSNREFTHITPEIVETESEITKLMSELQTEAGTLTGRFQNEGGKQVSPKQILPFGRPQESASPEAAPVKAKSDVVHSSLFSLARSLNTSIAARDQAKNNPHKNVDHGSGRHEGFSMASNSNTTIERLIPEQNHYDRDREGKQGQQEEQKQEQQQKRGDKKKKIVPIGSVQTSVQTSQDTGTVYTSKSSSKSKAQAARGQHIPPNGGGIDNIYIRFMALMARILGQSEMEAHQLYLRIKERTDNIDTLTLLVSKINSEKGAIDWSQSEEMKMLVEKARALGVDIPEGKYTWSEEEKKLLKENISMRKDSMEKVTQLERTDMQRYLQEASQCHQARSNVLKLLKEVVDTIVANMRA